MTCKWIVGPIAVLLLSGCEAVPELLPAMIDAALVGSGCPDTAPARVMTRSTPLLTQAIQTNTVRYSSTPSSVFTVYRPSPVITPNLPVLRRPPIVGPLPRPRPRPPSQAPTPPRPNPRPLPPSQPTPSPPTDPGPESSIPGWHCILLGREAPDCTGVADEYDELMLGDFLVRPNEYSELRSGEISREQYETEQRGSFRLLGDRAGLGVALVHTNAGALAKLLYRFEGDGDGVRVVLRDVIRYDQQKGDQPVGPLPGTTLAAGEGIDLDQDSGAATVVAENSDLWLGVDEQGTARLQAMNGAGVEFPIRSLCPQP